MIVNACGGDIRVAEPFLHLGDVGLMIERVGGCRAQSVSADQKSQLSRISSHQLIDAIRRDRSFELAGAIVSDRPEQCAVVVEAMP